MRSHELRIDEDQIIHTVLQEAPKSRICIFSGCINNSNNWLHAPFSLIVPLPYRIGQKQNTGPHYIR